MTRFDRRRFCKLIAVAPAATAIAARPGGIEEGTAGFPPGDYTPFGYLDNPWHTWDLHRSGVLRSREGIGFGWYYPAGPGGYFDYKLNDVYALEFSLGFQIGSQRFYLPQDFEPAQLSSPYHTKDILAYAFAYEGVQVTSSFALLNEDALGATVELRNGSGWCAGNGVFRAQCQRLVGVPKQISLSGVLAAYFRPSFHNRVLEVARIQELFEELISRSVTLRD